VDRYQPATRFVENGGNVLWSPYRGPGDTKFHCACFWNPKAIARFAEQPKHCSCAVCGNPRHWSKGQGRLTIQERRAFQDEEFLTGPDRLS